MADSLLDKAARKPRRIYEYMRHIENWHTVMLDWSGFVHQPYVLRMRNGVRFLIRPGIIDFGSIYEVFIEDCYKLRSLNRIMPGDVAVDIGANIGAFSAAALKAGASVHAFEPQPETFKALKANLGLQQNGRWKAHQSAVGSKKGTATLYFGKSPVLATLHRGLFPADNTDSVVVEMTTLQDIVSAMPGQRIDVLKMDCEGAEFDILENAPDSAFSRIGRIILEFHEFDGHTGAQLATFLRGKGFTVELNRRGGNFGMMYAWKAAPAGGAPKQTI